MVTKAKLSTLKEYSIPRLEGRRDRLVRERKDAIKNKDLARQCMAKMEIQKTEDVLKLKKEKNGKK